MRIEGFIPWRFSIFYPLFLYLVGLVQLLTGADRHGDPILSRRNRATIFVRVGAIWIISQVEVGQECPVAALIELEVAPGPIGLAAAGRVGKGHKIITP